jgi:hypothetical protein
MTAPLMPKATASWLLDNTTLTFEQIAEFCSLHPLEIQAMADGETFIVGVDPIATDQLTFEEIELATQNPSHKLELKEMMSAKQRRTGGSRYTPLSRRQDKPDAVSWLVRHHGKLSNNQIIKLIGTTKNTIDKIRERSHWNLKNFKPKSPVDLELCTRQELDDALDLAEKREAREKELKEKVVLKKEKTAPKKKVSAKKKPSKKK